MAIVFFSNDQLLDINYCGSVPTSKSATWDLKDSGAPVTNDEAAACILMDVPEGTIITLYDDPDGSTSDDYTTITVTENIYQYTMLSFEGSPNGPIPVNIVYHKHNGLNGKVSRIQVEAP